jgi:glycine hydroxymethyltransferase
MSNATQAARFSDAFFNRSLADADPALYGSIKDELGRQQHEIELIASENIVSRAVMEAQGSMMTNKYAEGLSRPPLLRRLSLCRYRRKLAIDRLANCSIAVRQCPAEFRQPGQPGCDAGAGQARRHSPGHEPGCRWPPDPWRGPNLSGKWFNAVQYGVRKEDGLLDYDQVEQLAHEHKPTIIIAGGSAYSRQFDFARFRAIADSVGAILLVDMAHFAGLVAGGQHPSPFPHAHVATTTTHKTLRGPRGGMC